MGNNKIIDETNKINEINDINSEINAKTDSIRAIGNKIAKLRSSKELESIINGIETKKAEIDYRFQFLAVCLSLFPIVGIMSYIFNVTSLGFTLLGIIGSGLLVGTGIAYGVYTRKTNYKLKIYNEELDEVKKRKNELQEHKADKAKLEKELGEKVKGNSSVAENNDTTEALNTF